MFLTEELVGLQLRIMLLSTERPPLQTLISGPVFSDVAVEFFELSLLREVIPL